MLESIGVVVTLDLDIVGINLMVLHLPLRHVRRLPKRNALLLQTMVVLAVVELRSPIAVILNDACFDEGRYRDLAVPYEPKW